MTRSLSSASQTLVRPPLGPRSLASLLVLLSQQYLQVLASPEPATFAAQQGKANWRSVWVQVLGWASLSALLAFVGRLISPGSVSIMGIPGLGLPALQGLSSPMEGGLSGSKATVAVFLPVLLIVVLLITLVLPFVGGILLFCLLGAYLLLLWEVC